MGERFDAALIPTRRDGFSRGPTGHRQAEQGPACEQQSPDAQAVLGDDQHCEHDQRVQLQVRAVDCLQPGGVPNQDAISLGLKIEEGAACRRGWAQSHPLLPQVRRSLIILEESLQVPLGHLIITHELAQRQSIPNATSL